MQSKYDLLLIINYYLLYETTDNFKDHGYDFFKLLVVIHLLMYLPLDFVILRYSIVKMVSNTRVEDLPWWVNAVITITLLAVILGVVLGIMSQSGTDPGKAFAEVLNITGGIAGIHMIYLFTFKNMIYVYLFFIFTILNTNKINFLYNIHFFNIEIEGSLLSFIIPALMYIKIVPAHKASSLYYIPSFLCLFFGVAVFFCVIIGSSYDANN